jgi:hypothetical protein
MVVDPTLSFRRIATMVSDPMVDAMVSFQRTPALRADAA